MEEPLLQVKELSIQFRSEEGPVPAVTDVSFTMQPGEVVALVGESGCGKSVTSLAIMDLLPPTGRRVRGEIWLEEQELTGLPKQQMRQLRGRKLAMIFQEPLSALNPVFTVGEQIAEGLRHHQGLGRRVARRESIRWLQYVGIPRAAQVYDAYPHQLSGGMRQRVMIAMALSCRPRLLIADEPTTALDVTIQAQVLQLMRRIVREQETAILLITHDLGVVAEMADRVVVMYAGRVVEQGEVGAIFQRPQHPYTQGLLRSTPQIQHLEEELYAIEGNVPHPASLPQGCKFHPRCPQAIARCEEEEPPLLTLAMGRGVRGGEEPPLRITFGNDIGAGNVVGNINHTHTARCWLPMVASPEKAGEGNGR